jgi:hypothetical protein
VLRARCCPSPRFVELFGASGQVFGVGQELESSSAVTGVPGENENPRALMAVTNIFCGETTPFRVITECGKVSEHVFKSSAVNKAWDIFQPHDWRSHFADSLGQVRPQPPLVIGAGTGSGD